MTVEEFAEKLTEFPREMQVRLRVRGEILESAPWVEVAVQDGRHVLTIADENYSL